MRTLTRDEFIEQYCEASGVSWEWLQEYRVAATCDCGEDGCEGWAMIPKDKGILTAVSTLRLLAGFERNSPPYRIEYLEDHAPRVVVGGSGGESAA